MKANYTEDGNKDRSSLRLIFIPFMAVVITLLVVVVALQIREYLSGSGTFTGFTDITRFLVGAGGTGFLAKIIQKWIELKDCTKPTVPPKPQPQPSPTTPIPSTPPPIPSPEPEPEPTYQIKGIAIDRIYENTIKTLAEAGIWDGLQYLFRFKTLELPWKDNIQKISRIPAGTYQAIATRRASNGKYGILLLDVPGRSGIMIHIANYVRELWGCFAPGNKFKDLDRDGYIDVANSKDVLLELEKHFPIGTELVVWVRDCFEESGNVKPDVT